MPPTFAMPAWRRSSPRPRRYASLPPEGSEPGSRVSPGRRHRAHPTSRALTSAAARVDGTGGR